MKKDHNKPIQAHNKDDHSRIKTPISVNTITLCLILGNLCVIALLLIIYLIL